MKLKYIYLFFHSSPIIKIMFILFFLNCLLQMFICIFGSGGLTVGGPKARMKKGPLMTSSYSDSRDKTI